MILPIVAMALLLPPAASSQTPATVQVQRSGDAPIYKITINVVERSTTAVNYRHRGGSTRLDFRGTPLLPRAHGEVEVEGRKGYMEIKTLLKDMEPASKFGSEYLTYVMWAITPEGRPVNLGEVVLDGDHAYLNVTTDLQAFGLIVTAEPYFAVTQPSDAVVLENVIRSDTKGIVEQVNAKYELLKRGQYAINVTPGDLKPIPVDKLKPLDLYEAQNAMRIARWTGADKDAADSFARAEALLRQAEIYQAKDPGSKPVSTTARGAVQAAEDARLIALKRQEDARLQREREDSAAREAQARVDADHAAQLRADAEAQQRLEAERRAAAEAQAERSRAEADAAAAKADAAAAKAALERQAAQAQLDQARQATEQARLDADQAQQEQQRLRQQLADQFNRILETRETSRGLVVNMSDVLFDVGKWTLKPGAREKLARIAGIIAQHPGLKLQIEGHTDSTGSDESNQVLSERRADAVRDFLVQQSIDASTITAMGMGKSQPVASNDTSVGRQLNRRVEMIVSGDIIGTAPFSGPISRR
jgi:outer membrane protein OmpA-like peptidoglycan-associated protein